MAKGLNARQQGFVVAYQKHGNATAAAIEAGYSEKTAHAIAHKLLKKPEIRAAFEQGFVGRAMSAEEVLWRLSEQARADIGDLMDDDGFIDLAKAKRSKLTRHIRKIKQVQTADGDILNNLVEVEIHDAQKALITLAKHYGLLIDRVQVSSGDVEDQIMAALKKGDIEYDVLQQELGASLADDLFRRAGVPVDAAR